MSKKQIISQFLVVLAFVFGVHTAVQAQENPPSIYGGYGAGMDVETGELLYDKNADVQAYPASITKIVTAYVMAEEMEPGEEITFSEEAIHQTRSRSPMFFEEGETMERDEAMYALMVVSANDVALAIAEHISGSEEAFGELMTEKVHALGATDSNFITASGLHHPDHVTTARDMALITREAMKDPVVMATMAETDIEVETSEQTGQLYHMGQIFDNDYAIGGKTGWTTPAGSTLVTVEEEDGKQVINVVMDSQINYLYQDIAAIGEFGRNSIETVELIEGNETETLTFLEKEVMLRPEESLKLMMPSALKDDYKVTFLKTQQNNEDYHEYLYEEGIAEGEVLGLLEVSVHGEVVGDVEMVSTTAQEFERPISFPYWWVAGFALVVPPSLYVGMTFYHQHKSRKRRKRRQALYK